MTSFHKPHSRTTYIHDTSDARFHLFLAVVFVAIFVAAVIG